VSSSALDEVAKAFCAQHGHKFIAPVGSGAFKQTFHVILASGEEQALKVYQAGFSHERTTREIEAMKRCTHPNICRLSSVMAFAIAEEHYFLSLEEYLPGGTLSARLVTGGLLALASALSIGRQLVSAVAHIASLELVHRDLKPDNILFRLDRRTPVIVDFGIVRDLVDSSLTQTWLRQGPGTPFFAPPEQLRNEKALIDWRSDQFSLGIVMSMSTLGFHPYSQAGMSSQEIVERVAQRQAPSPRFLEAAERLGLPMLMRMTAPWPVDRFRTPADLVDAWGESGT
jgi:serine/threonine protein kinase